MKNPIFILSALVIMAVSMLSSCQSSATKVENAEENVMDAKSDLNESQMELIKARQDSIADYQEFKKATDERIKAYEKNIADLKLKIANEKIQDKSLYEKKLAEMELKTTELKNKLIVYKEEGQDKWTAFKNEFNHDMDELGKSLGDLTKDNV